MHKKDLYKHVDTIVDRIQKVAHDAAVDVSADEARTLFNLWLRRNTLTAVTDALAQLGAQASAREPERTPAMPDPAIPDPAIPDPAIPGSGPMLDGPYHELGEWPDEVAEYGDNGEETDDTDDTDEIGDETGLEEAEIPAFKDLN